MGSKLYCIYILSNFNRTVLYIGVTSNLIKRVWQHKNSLADGFNKKYKFHDLVYYETYEDPVSAIEREKQFKDYSRKRKEEIILKFNPRLADLYSQLI